MNYECGITALETKVFPDLQEKCLADPKSGPCPCFKAGDTFLLKRTPEQDDFYHLMNGEFCAEAWNAISRYVCAALQGGSSMRKWTNDDRMMIACCKDGTRSVIFKIEQIDIPENEEEIQWLEKQNFRNTADDAYTGEVILGLSHPQRKALPEQFQRGFAVFSASRFFPLDEQHENRTGATPRFGIL